MPRRLNATSSWRAALLIGLGLAVGAGLAQGQQPAPAGQGLRTRSPPSVLADPLVQRCRLLAARRTDPKRTDSVTAPVEIALYQFRIDDVFDAVAACRAALAAWPGEPDVVIPHFTATEALSALALGLQFPDRDEEVFEQVLRQAGDGGNGLIRKLSGFFLGSAYEYGVGVRPDRAEAMKWYGVAAAAGDPISKRELARMQAARP